MHFHVCECGEVMKYIGKTTEGNKTDFLYECKCGKTDSLVEIEYEGGIGLYGRRWS